MKLKLHNFRCWLDKEVYIRSDGIVLISGPSGVGKTSIINAIYFALFGYGTKLSTHGKASCSVEMEFDGLSIKRTKRPNRLVVNNTYEDAAGQGIINNRFSEVFETISYLQQNGYRSFILMSPLEKLSFLERLSFRDVDILNKKKKVKELIQHRSENHTSKLAELNLAKGVIVELLPPVPRIFPLKGKNKNLAMRNEEIRYKNCETKIKKLRRLFEKLQKSLTSKRILEESIKIKKKEQERLLGDKEEKEKDLESCKYEGEEYISNLKHDLEILLNRKKLTLLKSRYENDRKKYQLILSEKSEEERIKKIDAELWNEMDKNECNDLIEEYTDHVKNMDRLDELVSNLEKTKGSREKLKERKEKLKKIEEDMDEIQTQISKERPKIYNCPNCEVSLILDNNSLHICDKVSENVDIKELEESLEKLQNLRNNLKVEIRQLKVVIHKEDILQEEINSIGAYEEGDEIRKDLKRYREYFNRMVLLEKEKNNIKSSSSKTLNLLKEDLEKQEEDIEKLRKRIENFFLEIDNEEELRKEINEQNIMKVLFRTITESLRQVENKLSSCNTELLSFERELESFSKTSYEKVEKLKSDISTQEDLSEIHGKNLREIENYKWYISKLENYKKWEQKVTRYTREEKISREKLTAANLLKEKIVEAESVAIANNINSINSHAQIYLDLFFNEPISVVVVAFKVNKKVKKPQINVKVEYKGMDCDISTLSGGERDRVILAFTLALSEINNSPIVLLDECIGSLDQNLATKVIDSIKENYNGKLVILIGHQIVKGSFDQVVNV